MMRCEVVSVGGWRRHAARADWNRVNRNKLVAVVSHTVTVTNVKLDGTYEGLQLKMIFIMASSADYFFG